MTGVPDGIEVVANRTDALALELPPLLIVNEVTQFLDAHGVGSGEVNWERIGDGQSNITYRISRGDEVMVLRRGPRPPLPKSAHDMIRESRLQAALREAGVKVPRILATCDDTSVLGVPFYVMEFLDGTIITDEIPEAISSPVERRATVFAAVDALVALHSVDVADGPLARFGRPAGYLERQVRLFSALWDQNTQRNLPGNRRCGGMARIPRARESGRIRRPWRLPPGQSDVRARCARESERDPRLGDGDTRRPAR